ncbi:unnamed protein product [Phaeothamnion confervicola]
MKFKRCSVNGAIYGEVTAEEKSKMASHQLKQVVDAPPLSALRTKVLEAKAGDTGLHFALCLALNHTVVVETDEETGKKTLQAESPDEEALVDGAHLLGVDFVGRRPGEVLCRFRGVEECYQLLATIPFDSTRKRMTVVLRSPAGKYIVYCKGADNIILDRVKRFPGSSAEVMAEHLSVFASDGLRTLLLAKKDLTDKEYEAWFKEWHAASVTMEKRTERLEEAAALLERDLEVLGATAIEDKLQDDVPATIADLGKAGVKVWVLTGDKMETAINIGYSCRLLDAEMTLIKIRGTPGDPKAVARQLRALDQHLNRLVDDPTLLGELWGNLRKQFGGSRGWRRMRGSSMSGAGGGGGGDSGAGGGGEDDVAAVATLPAPLLEQPEGAPPLSQISSDFLAVIIDGPTLSDIMGDPELEGLLLRIACLCKSVVACRVSPKQKSSIVRLVKKGVKPTPVTLAIGDGANDVGMIQEAQVGVGISGKEGRQAVNNADFAIAQFKFLKRLMLVHGHWDYRRLCKVILYSFYKNIVLVFVLFYFTLFSAYSGQSLYESLVYSGYNWFLAMPPLCIGLFDMDVRAKTITSIHKLYIVGRANMDMNLLVMIRWVVKAFIDSILVFFLPYAAYSHPRSVWAERGYEDGLYVFGTTVYSVLVLSMLFKVANLTLTWNGVSAFFFFGSIALYFSFIAGYSALLTIAYDFYHLAFEMMSRAVYWLLVIQVPRTPPIKPP